MSAPLALRATSQLPASPKPLYAQVRDLLLARIRGGEWAAGESLPNEYVLASGFDVSIGTVRRAVAELETNGVLVRKQGRGTYVTGCGATALQDRFCALRRRDGSRLCASFVLLSLQRRPAADVEQAALPAATLQGVVEIVQRIEADGMTVGLETSVLPAVLLPRLDTQLRFGQHLYPLMADYGLLVTHVEDSIGVEPATEDAAQNLGCAPGAPLLVVTRLAVTLDGQPVERRVGLYIAARVLYVGVALPA